MPDEKEWRELIEVYKLLRDLESKEFRKELEDLAGVLEAESLAASRTGDVLENRSLRQLKTVDVEKHTRDQIMSRLSRRGYRAEHLAAAAGKTTDLRSSFDSHLAKVARQLRQQAAILIRVADVVRGAPDAYAERLKALRRSKGGRLPSVAMAVLMEAREHWDVNLGEIARHLADAGVVPRSNRTGEPDLIRHWKAVLKSSWQDYRARRRQERKRG